MKKHRIRKMKRSPKNFTPNLNPAYPIPNEEEKIKFNFFLTLLCGASKGFMKAFKAFIKLFEAPQNSVKIKIQLNFFFKTTFRNAWDVKG